MKRFFSLLLVLIIVLSAFCFSDAASPLYFGNSRSGDFYIDEGETYQICFYTSPTANDDDFIQNGLFTFPAFLSVSENGGRWTVSAQNAKAGDDGTITCDYNGSTYSMPVHVNTPAPQGGASHGNWSGVNYTPAAGEVKSRAQLYVKDWIDGSDAGTEFRVLPDAEVRGPRFFTYPATETQYDNIRTATGWSFPSFLSMYLDRGGQWNYTSYGAYVGDIGSVTYFQNGVLYSMTVRVIDPYTVEPEELPEGAFIEKIETDLATDQYVSDETVLALLAEYATGEEKDRVAAAGSTENSLEMKALPAEEDELTRSAKEKTEVISETYDLTMSIVIKDGKSGATLARDIPVTELERPVLVSVPAPDAGKGILRVLRVHEGKVDEVAIEEIDEEARTVCFYTDRFSLYSVAVSKQVRVSYLDKEVLVDYGTKMTAPEDAEKEKYRITGWYEDEALTVPFDFEKSLTDHVTIYPAYEKISPFENPALKYGILGAAALIIFGILLSFRKKKEA